MLTARRPVVTLLCLVVLLLAAATLPAVAQESPLETAQREGREAQAELDGLLQRLSAIDAEREDLQARLAELQERARVEGERAARADAEASRQVRELYIHGGVDHSLALLVSDSAEEVAEQARLLAFLAEGSQTDYETAAGSQTVTEADAERTQVEIEQLQARGEELAAARAEAERTVQDRLAEVERIRVELEREEAARRRSGGGGAVPSAPVNGEVACPVGEPLSYSDTWGSPRSGGRSHKGVDMMAPHGTPLYAYENGTISRMSSNSLGGTTLYLNGDSGNVYYYAHLSAYVDGIDVGDRVTAGQHIGVNGASGNAPVPHLHLEIRPGGGDNVNPYPYVYRACG